MRLFSSTSRATTTLPRALRYAAAAGLALGLAGPAAAGEAAGGTMEPAKTAPDQPAKDGATGPEAATYSGSIFPLGDTDTYSVRLPGGSGRIFTFTLFNGTRGFDPAMVIRGGGKAFLVNRNGPGGGEVYKVLVKGTVIAKVTVGAFHGRTVGNYVLRVTP